MTGWMGLFQKLKALFARGAEDAPALIFYVRCARCGEVIRVRADRRWDLLEELGDEGVTGYSLHKDVLGTQCNAMMRMHVRFNRNFKITHQDIEGGRFVPREEHESLHHSRAGVA